MKILSEHGKPPAYLVDVDHYDSIQARTSILEGIERGETALQEDKVLSHNQAKSRMDKW